MSVQAILSCKLYKSSPRKDKIKAALANPINVELVQQLSEYLDDEYTNPVPPVEEYDESQSSEPGNGKVDDSKGGSPAPSTPSSPPSSSTPSAKPAPEAGAVENDGDVEDEISDEGNNGESDKQKKPEVESSTKVTGAAIKASSTLHEELKGTLNVRQDTAGVERVALRDSEIWIYYNDKINLNNVMTPVIEILNAAAYSYLTFNRLARSENAIVFELSIDDTNDSVQPVEQDEDKK